MSANERAAKSIVGKTVQAVEVSFCEYNESEDEPTRITVTFTDGTKVVFDAESHDWGGTEFIEVKES